MPSSSNIFARLMLTFNSLFKRTDNMSEEPTKNKYEMAYVHLASATFFSFMFLYNIYYTRHPTTQFEDSFTLLGPYHRGPVTTNDVYDQLINIQNFTFKINPQPCDEYEAGLLLVIIVSSKPVNYENRMLIRYSWGKSMASTKLVFLLAETDNEFINNKIEQESNAYRDIVVGSFIDAYRNMTYKHVMGLKWVAHHCPMAKYVLKTDDDIVVSSREIIRFLARELSPWGARGLMACQVLLYSPVQRTSSKWLVTVDEYPNSTYPPYCAGWAVLYSQDVVRRLLEAAQTTPYFWIDDIHVTGTVAQKIGVTVTSMYELFINLASKEVETFKPKSHQVAFTASLMGPAEMFQLWNAIPPI